MSSIGFASHGSSSPSGSSSFSALGRASAVSSFPPRRDGFDPEVLSSSPALYWIALVLRFLRLVVVVPVVEEIFWRGFLLRFLISESLKRFPSAVLAGFRLRS